jgi:protein-L-isoaspartate(D-aspartate) O-methyltransferase
MQLSAADQANQDMVDRLIGLGALWSPRLIAAFRATPRHRFLDRVFQYVRKHNRWREVATRDPGPECIRLLYSDRALITRLGRARSAASEAAISSSSQPSLMAQMLEDLKLAPGQRTLEIGAGTGYNAALLAHVVGPGLVTSVDVDRHVLAQAREHLREFSERVVELRHADGRLPLVAGAEKFRRIMVTAATPDLEPAWLEELTDDGVLLAPLALAPGLAYVVRGAAQGGVFQGRLTRAAYFMPLRAEDEVGVAEANEVKARGPLRTLAAPWAHWFDRRRPRLGWLGFIQSLAFFAWLQGLAVSYQMLANNQPAFGVADPRQGGACLLGVENWHTDGSAGRELGCRLWRGFLAAGGPWPTEYRLTATVGEGGIHEAGRECFVRQGPRCRHVWQLPGERDRPGGG